MEYNLLRYSDKHPEMARHLSPEIFFNYVGQLDTYIPESAAFIPRAELPGIESVDGSNHLCYQLYFEAGVIEGQLTFRLTFSDKIFSRQSINKLTAELLATIERNISVLNL
jgi:non-ribosomal peptide synthase protein (TIGR01720 family)